MGILYITRHGETEYNRLHLFMGRRNIELNKKGVAQAHELGRQLKERDIDFIVSSSLKRAKKTAEIINQYIQKELKIDDRLIEREAGVYEGLTTQELEEIQREKGYADDMEKIYQEIPPHGESAEDVQKRVFAALDEFRKDCSDKKIVIITHAFVVRMIKKYFNPGISAKEFFDFQLKNAEIHEVKF